MASAKITIAGAGIFGLACAWELTRRGQLLQVGLQGGAIDCQGLAGEQRCLAAAAGGLFGQALQLSAFAGLRDGDDQRLGRDDVGGLLGQLTRFPQ